MTIQSLIENGTDSSKIFFGEEVTLTGVESVPEKWIEKDSTWSLSRDADCLTWEDEELISNTQEEESSNGKTFRLSFYGHEYNENDFSNKKYLDLIFRNNQGELFKTRYWLGTRIFDFWNTSGKNEYAFDFADVNSGINNEDMFVGGWSCFSSDSSLPSGSFGLRPVVTIDLQRTGWELTDNLDGSYILETNI